MCTKIKRLAMTVAVLMMLSMPAGQAEPIEQKRVILGLYDSSEDYNREADDNLITHSAAMVLNHLGMNVRYHDVQEPLPPAAEMENVHGILSWFRDDTLPRAEVYADWVLEQIRAGKKFVMMGSYGAHRDAGTGQQVPIYRVNQVYKALGLSYHGDYTDNPFVIEVVKKDSSMVEFERSLESEVGTYERVRSRDEVNRVYLTLRRTDLAEGESAAVVTTPHGGYVTPGYALYIEYLSDQMRWRVDPFRFFEEAFRLADRPRPDVTTLYGRRVFYSHIDGDGVRNISEIDQKTLSGAIIRDAILKKYELPVTVSFIQAEIDSNLLGSERYAALARDIFRLEHVEAGVHGYSHPLDWERGLTAFAIKGFSRPMNLLKDKDVYSGTVYKDAAVVTAGREKYLESEIATATQYFNRHIVPEDKRVRIYQWTGNCEPPAEALEIARRLGLRNINGGDSRFDRFYPSYTGVAPLTRYVGGQYQVHTSNSNENIYTDGWGGPYFGLKHVIESFEQTEFPTLVKAPPRRVSAMNIYYHFYSGEKQQAVDALHEAYAYVLDREMIPIFTSQYASMVEGFVSAKIFEKGSDGWRIEDLGDLKTLRLDGTDRVPDLERSKNIIGYDVWEGRVYVHVGDASEAELYLSDQRPSAPYLEAASTVPEDFRMNRDNVSFSTRAFRQGDYAFQNMSPSAEYRLSARDRATGGVIYREVFLSDKDGRLEVTLPEKGKFHVSIERV